MMKKIGGRKLRLRLRDFRRLILTIRINPDSRSEKRKNAFPVPHASVRHLKARSMGSEKKNRIPILPLIALVSLLARLVPGRPSSRSPAFILLSLLHRPGRPVPLGRHLS